MGKVLKVNNKVTNNIKTYNSSSIIPLKKTEELVIELARFLESDLYKYKTFAVGVEVGQIVGDISTPNVSWKATSAQIAYVYGMYGIYEGEQVLLYGADHTATSSSFEQNLTDQPIIRNVTFTAVDGKTYTTTVTQGAYSPSSYTLTLTGITDYGFVKNPSAMPSLAATYDGVYQSNSQGINNSYAVARIDFEGYTEFTVWINSYAEGSYDYTIASQLDASTYPTQRSQGYNGNGYSTDASGSEGKYSNTGSFQHSIDSAATAPVQSIWRKITYACTSDAHHIFITYRKDSSSASGDDTGRFIVEDN